MSLPRQKILGMVATIGERWLRRQLVLHSALALAGLLGWLLVMILLDNLAMLSSGQFVLGWVFLAAGALGWTTLVVYRRALRRPTAARLALLYEGRVPERRNRLINAVQFIESRQAQRDALACAAVLENAAALDAQSAPRAVDFRPARDALLGLAVCAALLLGYSVLRPRWTGNALVRLFHPLAPTAHLLATEPIVWPGDVELVEGASLTIEAAVPTPRAGRVAEGVMLEYRLAGFDWAQTAMVRVADEEEQTAGAEPGRYVSSFDAVRRPLAYRVRAGRSVSSTYRVSLQYRPRIDRLQVTIRRPKYAGGQARVLKPNVGDVSALEGSIIELRVTATASLSAGQIELADGATGRPVRSPAATLRPVRSPAATLRPVRSPAATFASLEVSGPDRRQASGRFTLARSGTYVVRLTDTAGLSNLHPPRYTLTAEPDQPPLALVTVPGRDLILPANAEVELTIETADDIGLARGALQVRRGAEAWKTIQEWPVPEKSVRRHAASVRLSLAGFELEVDDVLLYRALAWDRRQPQPNVGIGRTWSITVAEPDHDRALLAAQTRRLLDALKRILALQKENRSELDLDRALNPIRQRQDQVRDLTAGLIARQRKSLRPTQSVITELAELADGLMLQAVQMLAEYGGTYQQRLPRKKPILDVMDAIIARLEALVGKVAAALGSAEKAQEVLERLPPEQRDQALQRIHDLLEKLRDFMPEQDQVIAGTEELLRKGEDLTDEDLQKIERLKGTEDKWAEVFIASVKDISKLTEQGFADRSLANDYKEMVEQIEAASLNLTPELIELAVPREQAGRELAESLVEEMEMWLPNSPDHIKWMMEEPLDFPEIPMVDLPDQLWDLIGELIEDQDELNDAAEDMTSAWADSLAEGAGWEVADGPISNFSAVGKTGNQLPDDHELSGRAGEGRSGRSQGQLVESVAKGLGGRKTPTRITNDPYEQGVVKELQQMATGGATGGGKARGAGQEGLQGQSPPPLFEELQFMTDWQKRIRQKAERVAGQLRTVRLSVPALDRSIALMKQAEQAAGDGRYAELFKIQQMVVQNLRISGELGLRDLVLRVDRAYHLPANQRRQILDAMDEPVPQEYQDAVRRYFEQLSEGK